MKKKVVWLLVTIWMVAALLLTSCAPAAIKEEAEKVAPPKEKEEVVVPKKEVVAPKEEGNLVKWTGKKLDGTVVEKIIEKPKYGGTHIVAWDTQPIVWDNVPQGGGQNWATTIVNEFLLTKDWTRGPGGTGEWDGALSYTYPPIGLETGLLAESWEVPEPETVVFHLRKGVRWALDPSSEASRLVGGREFTADDVVYAWRRNYTVGYLKSGFPFLLDMKNVANSIYVSPTDKWTVVMKGQPGGGAGLVIENSTMKWNQMVAPEVTEKYGVGTNKVITDWKHVVGTGAFTLKDYVGGSALTYARNPNYWGRDPFFPENQLPYVDVFKLLIIPDLSTRQAALRTGKVDNLHALDAEDAEPLMKSNPELGWVSYLGSSLAIFMRNDTKPFDDIQVRRALSMAINKRTLVDLYYGGKAELFAYHVAPTPELMDLYTPLEKMSESVQELYNYNPEKAKKLLAEAGYPTGFKTEILAWSTEQIDMLSIVKEDWAKIGVDLKIDVRDQTVYATMGRAFTYKQMYMSTASSGSIMLKLVFERPGTTVNRSIVNDPLPPEVYRKSGENYFDRAKKRAVFMSPLAEVLPHLNLPKTLPNYFTYASEQAWFIPLPAPYSYGLWQPWLKGYNGAMYASMEAQFSYAPLIWIDRELKKAMGY